MCDAKEKVCLNKLLRDKLNYSPKVDMEMIEKANMYMMNSLNDFKSHFNMWIEREEHFIESLNSAIKHAGSIDMELYKKLCCLVEEVQCEVMRTKMTYNSLELGGWNGHDISVKSKWLHEHFEEHPDSLDFNIG